MKHLQALKSNHIFFMLVSCMTFRHLYKITRITIFLECIASQTNFENPVPDASVKVYEYFTSPQGRQMNEHDIASWRSLTERIWVTLQEFKGLISPVSDRSTTAKYPENNSLIISPTRTTSVLE